MSAGPPDQTMAEPQPPAEIPAWWSWWAVVAAFGCYFCAYGFRKPFTAASFEGAEYAGIGFKTLLITAQVIGYTISKFIGIRVIAEMPRRRRALAILLLIGTAELALVLFGLVPRPWNAVCLFFNGLPLGLIFGLVLGFLEGRRQTEALAAGLCASFIVADGATKSLGTWLLRNGVPEDWMPGVAGAVLLLPLGLFVAMLASLPAPSLRDIAARTERVTLDRVGRLGLLRRLGPGLAALTVIYVCVTVLRSIRADFAPELWRELGLTAAPAIFTQSELLVAAGILVVSGSLAWIEDNRRAFFASLLSCALGFVVLAVALAGLRGGWLGGFAFMVLVGLGLYLPYVAMQAAVFERMLAMTRESGNIGFLVYVIDAVGYLGYVVVMLIRNYGQPGAHVLGLLKSTALLTVILSLACLAVAWAFFARRAPSHQNQARGESKPQQPPQ